MKAEHINPFIESVFEVFENMLECKPEMGGARLSGPNEHSSDLVGIIGLSGTAQFTVAVRLPVLTALAIISKMLGIQVRTVDSGIIDGVGEIVNIIAGNAKAKFEGHDLSMSLPTVIRGNILKSDSLQDCEWLELPFSSSLGDFSLSISFKRHVLTEKEATHESAGC